VKIGCKNCGIHFPEDYVVSLTPVCNFWGEHGIGNLPDKYKLQLWDWIFSLPTDAIFIDTGISMLIDFAGIVVPKDKLFENKIPNWNKFSEAKRKQIERDHFKNIVFKTDIKKPIQLISEVKN